MHPLPFLLTLLATTAALCAATHTVLPGGSIQTKIDSAQPGDIIAIFGGTYPDDLTITKPVRLAEIDGQEVTITGNITFSGLSNPPPFEGFIVGSPGKGITIDNTTNFSVNNVDGRNGFGLKIMGNSRVSVIGGEFAQIDQDGGELTTRETGILGAFNTTPNSVKTVCLRSTVGNAVTWNSKKAWFGYSSARRFGFFGSHCNVVITGATIDAANAAWDAMPLHGSNNQYQVLNSVIKNVVHGDRSQNTFHGWHSEPYPGRAMFLSAGNQATIANNYIHMISVGYLHDSGWGEGILSQQASGCRAYNNIVVGAKWGFNGPFGADVRNNLYAGFVRGSEVGGVVSSGAIFEDPLFVAGMAPALQPTSPCINAGVSDPIFNDLDGTRNDIGPGGGCFFDPEAWTTDKPIVISFDLGPSELLRGADTLVTLSNGQAVSGK